MTNGELPAHRPQQPDASSRQIGDLAVQIQQLANRFRGSSSESAFCSNAEIGNNLLGRRETSVCTCDSVRKMNESQV